METWKQLETAGNLRINEGKFPDAERIFGKAHLVSKKLSAPLYIGKSLHHIGRSQIFQYKFDKCLENYLQAEKILLTIDSKDAKIETAAVWENMIYVYSATGKTDKLLPLAWKIRNVGIEDDVPQLIAIANYALVFFHYQHRKGSFPQAIGFLEQARTSVDQNDYTFLGDSAIVMSSIYGHIEELSLARFELGRIENYLKLAPDVYGDMILALRLGSHEKRVGRLQSARVHWLEYLELAKRLGRNVWSANPLYTRIEIAFASHKTHGHENAINQINELLPKNRIADPKEGRD